MAYAHDAVTARAYIEQGFRLVAVGSDDVFLLDGSRRALDGLRSLRVTVAIASAEHPRNSEGAVFQRSDGSLLLIYQEYLASERGGGDDAPNRLVAVVSNDGGRSWAGKRVVAEPAPNQINVYSPSLLPSQRGELLLFYYAYQTIGSGQEVDSTGYLVRSTDEGEHFGDRRAIWEHRPFGCASSAVKRLPSGRLLFPVRAPYR